MFPAQKARVRHVQAPNCQKIKGFVADFLKFFFFVLEILFIMDDRTRSGHSRNAPGSWKKKKKTIPTLIAINTTFGSITYSNLGKPYPGVHMRNVATIPSLVCCLNVGA